MARRQFIKVCNDAALGSNPSGVSKSGSRYSSCQSYTPTFENNSTSHAVRPLMHGLNAPDWKPTHTLNHRKDCKPSPPVQMPSPPDAGPKGLATTNDPYVTPKFMSSYRDMMRSRRKNDNLVSIMETTPPSMQRWAVEWNTEQRNLSLDELHEDLQREINEKKWNHNFLKGNVNSPRLSQGSKGGLNDQIEKKTPQLSKNMSSSKLSKKLIGQPRINVLQTDFKTHSQSAKRFPSTNDVSLYRKKFSFQSVLKQEKNERSSKKHTHKEGKGNKDKFHQWFDHTLSHAAAYVMKNAKNDLHTTPVDSWATERAYAPTLGTIQHHAPSDTKYEVGHFHQKDTDSPFYQWFQNRKNYTISFLKHNKSELTGDNQNQPKCEWDTNTKSDVDDSQCDPWFQAETTARPGIATSKRSYSFSNCVNDSTIPGKDLIGLSKFSNVASMKKEGSVAKATPAISQNGVPVIKWTPKYSGCQTKEIPHSSESTTNTSTECETSDGQNSDEFSHSNQCVKEAVVSNNSSNKNEKPKPVATSLQPLENSNPISTESISSRENTKDDQDLEAEESASFDKTKVVEDISKNTSGISLFDDTVLPDDEETLSGDWTREIGPKNSLSDENLTNLVDHRLRIRHNFQLPS